MHDNNLAQIWVYLSTSPLLGLTMTLIAYGLAYRLYVWARFNPLLNPVVTAVGLLIALLLLTKTPYRDYFAGGQFVHFLLELLPLHGSISFGVFVCDIHRI